MSAIKESSNFTYWKIPIIEREFLTIRFSHAFWFFYTYYLIMFCYLSNVFNKCFVNFNVILCPMNIYVYVKVCYNVKFEGILRWPTWKSCVFVSTTVTFDRNWRQSFLYCVSRLDRRLFKLFTYIDQFIADIKPSWIKK